MRVFVVALFLFCSCCVQVQAECPLVGNSYMTDVHEVGGTQCVWAFTDFECDEYYEWGCMGTCTFWGQTPGIWSVPAEFMCGAENSQYAGIVYIRYFYNGQYWTDWVECEVNNNDLIYAVGQPGELYFHKI